jgi:RES domain-containing protein
MLAWRLARESLAQLDGEGARLYGGRWNSPGRAMVYMADSASLAVLEVWVHLDLPFDLLPADYSLMAFELTNTRIEEAPQQALVDPRKFGDAWLATARSPILRVPSFIVPEETNLLINPLHPISARITLLSKRPFSFDQRLF